MVVGVRKNMMLLFENKLSYIFCVVGAGVTKAEWAWWFIKLNQRCWHVYFAWYFSHAFCEIWINCGYVWLWCCRIGDVWYCFWKCEKLMFVPLQKFSATSQTLSLRHPNSATSDPLVAQRLWMAGPRAGRFAVNCKHCAKYPWLCSVIQQIWCWLPFSSANGCWCGILNA